MKFIVYAACPTIDQYGTPRFIIDRTVTAANAVAAMKVAKFFGCIAPIVQPVIN